MRAGPTLGVRAGEHSVLDTDWTRKTLAGQFKELRYYPPVYKEPLKVLIDLLFCLGDSQKDTKFKRKLKINSCFLLSSMEH